MNTIMNHVITLILSIVFYTSRNYYVWLLSLFVIWFPMTILGHVILFFVQLWVEGGHYACTTVCDACNEFIINIVKAKELLSKNHFTLISKAISDEFTEHLELNYI